MYVAVAGKNYFSKWNITGKKLESEKDERHLWYESESNVANFFKNLILDFLSIFFKNKSPSKI